MKDLKCQEVKMPIIDRFIRSEAEKLAERYDKYHNFLHQEFERKKKRYINPPEKVVKTPLCWDRDSKFNPYYVLNNYKQIAKSVRMKLNNGSYKPFPPYQQEVQKKDGGCRIVNVYQIPDAAVSNYLYYKLLSKNKHRFSYYAYAYRDDKNAHYAIQDIAIELKAHERLFIAEYDFSDFFGSISHEYLFEQMDRNGFVVTQKERALIKTFLPDSGKGIPQGTSISLFLANLVCWQLDKQLELEGVKFARYADDTIIWTEDYQKICNSFKIINSFSKNSKVKINYKKSSGINLLTAHDTPSEFMNSKEHIEFLGYKLSCESISIKEESCNRIKKNIAYILHENLLQPLVNHLCNSNPLSLPQKRYDAALLVAVSQIRRYLYGNLTDEKIQKYLSNIYKKLEFKGLMSFYPLVDNVRQLRQLDGWLVNTIMSYLKRRYAILRAHNHVTPQIPLDRKDDFLEYCKTVKIKEKDGLLRIPSFIRIYRAIEKGINTQGIMSIVDPRRDVYDYEA